MIVDQSTIPQKINGVLSRLSLQYCCMSSVSFTSDFDDKVRQEHTFGKLQGTDRRRNNSFKSMGISSTWIKAFITLLHQEVLVGKLSATQWNLYFFTSWLSEKVLRHYGRLNLLVSLLGHVDPSGFSGSFRATRQIHGISEKTIARHSVSNYSSYYFTGMNADCDPLKIENA